MAKKSQDRKNSRAARRGLDVDPDLKLDDSSIKSTNSTDAKTRVFQKLSEKEQRDSASRATPLDDELLAISQGNISLESINNPAGKVTKLRKKSKADRKKQAKAEMLKDVLSEKIKLAKERHKTIRNYRKKEDDEE